MADSILDEAAKNFARILASRKTSTGHQPAPDVQVDESVLDPRTFGLELNPGGFISGAGGGGGIPLQFFILMEDNTYVQSEAYNGILTEDQSA
jgi:hypothetical protein